LKTESTSFMKHLPKMDITSTMYIVCLIKGIWRTI